MSKRSAVPAVPGIDLDSVPRSYFTERDLQLALPSDILGKARRDTARQLVAHGEDVPPELLTDALSESDRRAFGRIHPAFMGGEYLPPLQKGEVEIARISLQSVTADQISVRAIRTGNKISYSIVDEYPQGGFITYSAEPSTSRTPVSLRALVAMLDRACDDGGAVMSHTMWHIEEFGEPEDYRYFASIKSDFYPDVGRYYEARFDQYISAYLARPARRSTGKHHD